MCECWSLESLSALESSEVQVLGEPECEDQLILMSPQIYPVYTRTAFLTLVTGPEILYRSQKPPWIY
jgi:hypothetical protein